MAARDLRILLKTASDVTGLTRLGRAVHRHSAIVRGLGSTYKAAAATARAGFGVLQREMRMARNVALGAAGALAVTVREGAKFNVSLARTVNMFGGSRIKNFVRFRKEILSLSSTLGIAKEDITAALYQAGSAQMDPEQAFQAIRKAAQGVIADGAEMSDVMRGIIAAVKSFGGDVDTTAEQLYRIVQLGQTTFGEVGQYLSQVGPVAQANKVSITDVAAAMAQMTSKTINTSQAVIYLRNMISRLNEILGDGWSETRSFQEAMEEVAKSVNYSQSEMTKLFGREGMAGVSAMVGENFASANAQLDEFTKGLTGLRDAAEFSDQFRGWSKVWQSIHSYVVDIGSEIEQRWAPRIQMIAAKINEMREGDGFTNLVDSIATKLESTITWVIVQVQTAADLIQHLREGDFGISSIAEILKTVVVELVTLAVTLLLAQLRAASAVFVGLAKVMANALRAEVMKMDMPFRNEEKAARKAALKRMATMTPDEAESLGLDPRMAGGGDSMLTPRSARRREKERERWAGDLSLDQAVAIATAGDAARMQAAFDQAKGRMSGIGSDVSGQWGESSARIKAAATRATGGAFDWDAEAAANRAGVRNFMPPLSAGAEGGGAGEGLGKAAANSNAALKEAVDGVREVLNSHTEGISALTGVSERTKNEMQAINDRIKKLPL